MTITTYNLEAAIIDQNVAGAFAETPYAFIAVYSDADWQLGVAVANERGFNPIGGKTFKSREEATRWADDLNQHIGRTEDDIWRIVCSTMGGRFYYPEPEGVK